MAQWNTIKTIFGQWCIDTFGETNSNLVYDVYRNILKFDIKQNKFVQQKNIKILMRRSLLCGALL